MNSAERVAVVTGGGSGIGRAVALELCRSGAQVVVVGRTIDKLEETRRLGRGAAHDMLVIAADVSRADQMEAVFRDVESRFGRLDQLFAHAGINGVWAPIEDLSPDEWEKTVRINLSGTFLTVKYAVPLLKKCATEDQRASIVITSSINGVTKFSDVGSSAYSATKAGLLGFMKLMAVELAPSNIRVNAICPGSIDTDVDQHTQHRNTEANAEVADYHFGGIPLTNGVAGTPEQVADLVLFLMSDRAHHITGTSFVVDGGQSLIQ